MKAKVTDKKTIYEIQTEVFKFIDDYASDLTKKYGSVLGDNFFKSLLEKVNQCLPSGSIIRLSLFWQDEALQKFVSKPKVFLEFNSDEGFREASEIYNKILNCIKSKFKVNDEKVKEYNLIDIFKNVKSAHLWLLRPYQTDGVDRFFEICKASKKFKDDEEIEKYRNILIKNWAGEEGNLLYIPVYWKDKIFFDVLIGFSNLQTVPQNHISFMWNLEKLFVVLFNKIHVILRILISRHYALRSAIAAIMSRNMSHNIGSHVLAYLRLEKLFELAVKFVNTDDEKSINKIKDLINKIEQYGNKVQSFCNKLKNANNNGVKEELNTIKEQMHSHKEEIQNIINSLTGSELRWGLMEWIEDTKIFFEYLQHRMDFLAQISTEWPEWSFSAYLMKDIMRYFLSQRHLLDGIAKSEGLRGFYYDWEEPYKQYLEAKQKSDQGKSEEYGRIKFHVVNLACFDIANDEAKNKVKEIWYGRVDNDKINEHCKIKKRLEQIKEKFSNKEEKRILLYTKEKDSEVNIEEGDIQIAIPGGIIGYHAFYVIVENIIRNSAKHSYNKNKIEDLEIVIEFTDDPFKHDEFWLFRIYDNASCALKDNNAKVEGERFRIFSEDVPDNNDNKKTPEHGLVAFMNECLRHSIIKETGELDKKHWGMAEMKIAAGYLQGRDISRIGAKGNDITGSENNQDADEEDFIIRAVESPVGTLGFEFKVRKPKEVGIVCYKKEKRLEDV